MNENRAVTYSLLAHIRNSGTLIRGPIDVFVPLIKRVLHQLNNKDIFKGKSITEIQIEALNMYSIEFPIPVLKVILKQIEIEVNTEEETNFTLFNDGGFIVKPFLFESFEEKIQESKRDTENLEKLFIEFCNINNVTVTDKTSIFDFIEKNKLSISKYLANKYSPNGHDYTIEAQFVDYFKKIPHVYEIVRRIYLGSIISSFLEYKVENVVEDIELLFDTNFIISLLDLNTPESTHTCRKLIEIGQQLSFKFSILNDTIEETKALIHKKADNYSNTFLTKQINPEDIYNACERRKLTPTDLERIIDNLEQTLRAYHINIIPYTEPLKSKAKSSVEYENFKRIRSSHYSALHDAIAVIYVKERRKKRIREFEKVNCWFVNNSTTHDMVDVKEIEINSGEFQKETIRVDELLNILWLTSPQINKTIDNDDLIEIGLSSIVAYTLNETLPKANIIKELDENIQKYRTDAITDKDILRISSRISNRQLKNIAELNKLAEVDNEKFIDKIKQEALLQEKEEKERVSKFDKIYQEFEKHVNTLDRAKLSVKSKEAQLDLEIQQSKDEVRAVNNELEKLAAELEDSRTQHDMLTQKVRREKREKYVAEQIKAWRRKSWYLLAIYALIIMIAFTYILYLSDWSFKTMIKTYKDNLIATSILTLAAFAMSFLVLRNLREKYYNQSNIKAFRDMIVIPDDLS